MKQSLWTRNFKLVFIGMIFSAAGGVGLSVAMSVIVFQETQSTSLTAVFTAFSMLPQFVLPLIMGPIIDRKNPLRVMIRNEGILAFIFFCMAGITWKYGFSYPLYMAFSVLINCFAVVSNLASGSILPQVMRSENYVRGNAIVNVIFPLCSVMITPLAMVLFDRFGVSFILCGYGVTTLIDIALESRIDHRFEFIEAEKTSLKEYVSDLRDGIGYLRENIAVRSVFVLFVFVMFSDTSNNLIYPFFNQSATLNNTYYATLSSIQSAGYMVGGFLHYFIKIPDSKRFRLAIFVYFLFCLLDGVFFFMPFWMMCASKFILGIAGMNSANIRVSAIQNRVPNQYRAKINALYTVLISAAIMLGGLVMGALGEMLPYWLIQLGSNCIYFAAVLLFALPRKNKVRELYNYTTVSEAPEVSA